MRISNNFLALLTIIFIIVSLANSVTNIRERLIVTGKVSAAGTTLLGVLPNYPAILDLVGTIDNESAIITWTTAGLTNSSIHYGTTSALSSTESSTSYVTSHNLTLSSLTNNTLYYYNVTSCYSFGPCNTTGPFNFTTLQNVAPSEDVIVPPSKRRKPVITIKYPCMEKWRCTEWSACSPNGVQNRECYDVNSCGTTYDKLDESRACEYKVPVIRLPTFIQPKIIFDSVVRQLQVLSKPWLTASLFLIALILSITTIISIRRAIIGEIPHYDLGLKPYDPNKKIEIAKKYIEYRMKKGINKDNIKKELEDKGWPDKIIKKIIKKGIKPENIFK